MSEELGETARMIFDALPTEVELRYVDYKDEMPEGFYRKVLEAGASGRELVDEMFYDVYDVYESAKYVVEEAASSVGIRLSSPIVSIDSEEYYVLVDEVMDRDTSDPWNCAVQIARRDTLLLGMHVGEAWFDWTSPGEVEDLMEEFGMDLNAQTIEWAKKVLCNGDGAPTIVFGMDGDDLLGLVRDAYVADREDGKLMVEFFAYDGGVLNRYSGSGWIEPFPSPVFFRLSFADFVAKVWIDNEPRSRGTWSEVLGHAEASRPTSISVYSA